VTRPGFKTFLKWLIVALAAVILMIVLAIAFKNPILRAATCWNIKSTTGLDASIGTFDLNFGRSQLDIRDFRIANAPTFGPSPLLDIGEIYFSVKPRESGKLHFDEVRFNLRQINVVQATNGVTNIELLQKTLETNLLNSSQVRVKGLEFGGIDKIVVSLGKVTFKDMANPTNDTQIDLGVKEEARNLKTEEEVQNWATALLLRVAIQQSFNARASQGSPGVLQKLLQGIK